MSAHPDRASQWATKARALGMSYGQYVAKYHPPGAVTLSPVGAAPYIKTCPECGQVFRTTCVHRIYCCEDCYRRHSNHMHYQRSKEKRKC